MKKHGTPNGVPCFFMVNGTLYWACKHHEADKTACPITQVPEAQVQQAFLRLYYNLKYQGSHILPDLITNLQSIRERKFLWSVDAIELNRQIAELTRQNQLLDTLREGGCVVSDVHGYYTQMKSALEKAGFFSDTTPHKLIMLGDLFDRGHEAKQLQQFILEQMEQDRIILIRGNHEDLFVELVTTDAAQTADENKTIVCGHWHTSYGHSKYEHKGSEFGEDADFSPYYGPGIIAIDACTAFSGKVNCLVIED